MTRRARTKRLIELGALVEKAGLADLAGEDRALLYGALLDVTARLGAADSASLAERLRQYGSRPRVGDPEALNGRDKGGTGDG